MPQKPIINWWEDSSNFPCMLIANLDGGDALAWVHYAINNIAYDCRDATYSLDKYSNWRRATPEEVKFNTKNCHD